ncbi:MAG TPA: DUF481 domain-containing protein [Bryobacteraceae bacterium]|jgi:hypothetical protein|nr:DUF481 domain-containing protein [Bryobacteraceae bacterium]
MPTIVQSSRFFIVFLVVCGFSLTQSASAQPPKPQPDVLILVDGEKLIGHLESSDGGSLKFESDLAGEITVDLSKVQELHTSGKFAVLRKSQVLKKHSNGDNVPQGTIAVADKNIQVTPASQPPQTIPIADAGHVVDEASFQKALENPGFFHDWTGGITLGASLVEATQNSESATGSLTLSRVIPTVNWLDPVNRTTVDFSASYGEISQTGVPTVKTSIYHADAERDEFFSPRLYAFVQAAYDHNFSQGLNLQQQYGGGIGLVVLKAPNQELDLKGSMTYIEQSFQTAAQSQNLFGSTFAETYSRKFARSIVFTQGVTITPAWNNLNAYSGNGNATLAIPVYKRLNFSIGVIDTFLNDPPPGFKKNSFQATTGLTYAIK